MRLRRRALENLEQDIRNHIEHETRDNIDRGMAPEEARQAAIRKFGNIALVTEDTRAVWTSVRLGQLRAHAGVGHRHEYSRFQHREQRSSSAAVVSGFRSAHLDDEVQGAH